MFFNGSKGIFYCVQVVTGKGFEVPRRVYVDFEGINLRKRFLTGIEPEFINMTIGKLSSNLISFRLNSYYYYLFEINSPYFRLSADSETRSLIRTVIQWEDAVPRGISVSHHCLTMSSDTCSNAESRPFELVCIVLLVCSVFLRVKIQRMNLYCRCSRLYWSTMDPRRRCRYTCKVTEVSTPLPGEEQDPRWDKEENHTIVHSPTHHRGQSELGRHRITIPCRNDPSAVLSFSVIQGNVSF